MPGRNIMGLEAGFCSLHFYVAGTPKIETVWQQKTGLKSVRCGPSLGLEKW
jgi:hypothetical protein